MIVAGLCLLTVSCDAQELSLTEGERVERPDIIMSDKGGGRSGDDLDLSPDSGGPNRDQGSALELDGAPPALPLSSEELIERPSGWGPHPVGYHTKTIAYRVSARSEDRSLELAWWYPAASEGGALAPYLGGRSGHSAQANTAVLEGMTDAPVLVFSHGNGGVAEQSYFLTEHFASSNACEYAQSLSANDGCSERLLPYEEAHRLVKLYALAFARQHTLGGEPLTLITRGALLPEGAAELLSVNIKV